MNKRDLKADFEICNKATPGPWKKHNTVVHALPVDATNEHDADFIAKAREGWPHAIERALKAELLVWELVDDLERARGNLLLILAGAEPDPKRYEIFLRKCTRTLSKAKEALSDA